MPQLRKKVKLSARPGLKTPLGRACLINCLPPETLIQILVLSCDDPTDIFKKPLLCHPLLTVCHHWRDLALNAPQFWKNITFIIQLGPLAARPDYEEETDLEFQGSMFILRQVERQIELVKNSPVNIDFEPYLPYGPESWDSILAPLTTLFRERLPQLRLFSYRENGTYGLWSFINAGRGNRYQDLSDLILDLSPSGNSWAVPPAPPSAENCTELPNLCNLRLAGCLLESPSILSGFQAPKLLTLDLFDLDKCTVVPIHCEEYFR
jgi:hypothetical protein